MKLWSICVHPATPLSAVWCIIIGTIMLYYYVHTTYPLIVTSMHHPHTPHTQFTNLPYEYAQGTPCNATSMLPTCSPIYPFFVTLSILFLLWCLWKVLRAYNGIMNMEVFVINNRKVMSPVAVTVATSTPDSSNSPPLSPPIPSSSAGLLE